MFLYVLFYHVTEAASTTGGHLKTSTVWLKVLLLPSSTHSFVCNSHNAPSTNEERSCHITARIHNGFHWWWLLYDNVVSPVINNHQVTIRNSVTFTVFHELNEITGKQLFTTKAYPEYQRNDKNFNKLLDYENESK